MKKAKIDWKSFTRQQKREYIWDYYKLHIIVGILVLLLGTYIVVKIVNHRDPLMSTIMLNCNKPNFQTQEVFDEFLQEYGYESYSQAVKCHANLSFWEDGKPGVTVMESTQYENAQMMQAYHAMLYTNEYDLIFGTGEVMDETLQYGVFMDLTKVLPAEMLEIYADFIITFENEETGESYPCAILLSEENGWLQEHGLYKTCAVGILQKAPHKEIAVNHLKYLLAKNLALLTKENT